MEFFLFLRIFKKIVCKNTIILRVHCAVASLLADNITSGGHIMTVKGEYPLLVDLPTPALKHIFE